MAQVIRGREHPYYEAPGEFRRFGKFLLSPGRIADAPVTIGQFIYPPGARSHAHRHAFATEVYCCTAGELEAVVEGRPHRLQAGDLLLISPGEEHYCANPGTEEMRFLAVHTPPVSDYDEFTLSWQERDPETGCAGV